MLRCVLSSLFIEKSYIYIIYLILEFFKLQKNGITKLYTVVP